jgi:Kef-type K+ transport system membrane component KefB
VLVFFGITLILGAHVYPRVSRGLKSMQAAALEFSVLAAVGLAYGLLAEALGMHWIMGAFMAGLFFEPSRVGQETYDEIRLIFTAITGGFLAPLFFASIGLRVDLNAITMAPIFLTFLLIVALFSKVVGAGLPAFWLGMPRREAVCVGVGMSARGAVGFVVLSIAYDAGLFERIDRTDPVTAYLFSGLILVAVITTMLTPLVLRRLLSPERDE